MKKIKYPNKIDFEQFSKDKMDPSVLYGLPKNIQFCRKCIISNQRPNSAIEYDHKSDTKKVQFILMKMEYVMLVILQ